MKLIIDIPEEAYEYIKATSSLGWLTSSEYADAIRCGVPLDDVRAKIEKLPTDYCGGYVGLDKKEVLQIIDSIGNEPRKSMVSRAAYEQIMWERDVAIQQLQDLGYGLGEKPREGE